MSTKLILAIIAMTLALTFYTLGVFWERRAKRLEKKHILLFFLGLICDSTGTAIMKGLAIQNTVAFSPLKANIHEVTGALALILMAIHLIWAIYVITKGTENAKTNFHKFSIVVWAFWLIPYVLGMVIGMTN